MSSRRNKTPELIKCVLVGDTGVGKTKLISTKVHRRSANSDQLMLHRHVSTVWPTDQNRLYNEEVDGVIVSYRFWDTFGDHKIDRCFAYACSDVVIICFSVANRRSLTNAQDFWIKEVNSRCPKAAVVLVACKADLRFIFFSTDYEIAQTNNYNQLKGIKSDDIVLPAEGRAAAQLLGAYYYETTALNYNSVHETLTNCLRLALLNKRNFISKVWPSQNLRLSSVLEPTVQVPILPEKPAFDLGSVTAPKSTFNDDISFLSSDFANFMNFYDCVLKIERNEIYQRFAHKFVLAASCETFRILFCSNKPWHALSLDGKVISKIQNGAELDSKYLKPNSDFITVTLNPSFSPPLTEAIISFMYTAELPDQPMHEEFSRVAILIKMNCFDSVGFDLPTVFGLDKMASLFLRSRNNYIGDLLYKSNALSDLSLEAVDGTIHVASRAMLATRVPMIRGMFANDYRENFENQIKFRDVTTNSLKLLLQYLYFDSIICKNENLSFRDLFCALDLSTRFCLSRFSAFVEQEIIHFLRRLQKNVCCKRIVEDILKLSRLYECHHLTAWCFHFMCCNVLIFESSQLEELELRDREFVEKYGWPPAWYLDELKVYEQELTRWEKINEKRSARIMKNHKNCCSIGYFLNPSVLKNEQSPSENSMI